MIQSQMMVHLKVKKEAKTDGGVQEKAVKSQSQSQKKN